VNVEPELAGISAAEVMYILSKTKNLQLRQNVVRKPFYNSFDTKSGIYDNYGILTNFRGSGLRMMGNLRYHTAQSPLGGECSHTCGEAALHLGRPQVEGLLLAQR
jgi:hypothetical protein